jgi:proteic killer suppression protein
VIRSFKDPDAFELIENRKHRKYANVLSSILRKLDALEAAVELAEMKEPPGNRLEALKGSRIGQHSIRVNDQFRICFIWKSDGAYDVEIVDYH